MSVNFYALGPGIEPTASAGEPGLHIGQDVGGREFQFRGHRDRDLLSTAAWRNLLTQPGIRIEAESGYTVEFAEFWPDATARPIHGPTLGRTIRSREDTHGRPGFWRDPDGQLFRETWFC